MSETEDQVLEEEQVDESNEIRETETDEFHDLDRKHSLFKKAFFWICGIESGLNKRDVSKSIKPHTPDTSIEQEPFWSAVCDINAVIAIALSGFCIAFFNKYH